MAADRPGIWLGGLPKDIKQDEVEGVCSRRQPCGNLVANPVLSNPCRYGAIDDINIKHSERDTFVFVTFKRLEYAEAAPTCSN